LAALPALSQSLNLSLFFHLLISGSLMVKPANLVQIDRRLWQLELHVFHRVGNDLRDSEIPESFVVRRNNVPRRIFGRALGKCRFESADVLVPKFAL